MSLCEKDDQQDLLLGQDLILVGVLCSYRFYLCNSLQLNTLMEIFEGDSSEIYLASFTILSKIIADFVIRIVVVGTNSIDSLEEFVLKQKVENYSAISSFLTIADALVIRNFDWRDLFSSKVKCLTSEEETPASSS